MKKGFLAGIVIAALVSGPGCADKKSLVCNDLLNGNLKGTPDAETISLILDQSVAQHTAHECWQPLLAKCLEKGWDIPQPHLARALQHYNQNRYAARFHQTVGCYFRNITDGKAAYSKTTDRAFLEAYCRNAIQKAQSQSDPLLVQARTICEKVDPDLYNKLFS